MTGKVSIQKVFPLIVFLLTVVSCSSYKDYQTVPPDDLPDSVIRTLSDAFPAATDATFQTIEKDKLYEVNYKLNGDAYYAALTTSRILSVYRMYGAVPDSMQQALPERGVNGGQASVYREPVPQPNEEKQFVLKYAWSGQDYILTWFQDKPTNAIRYFIRLEPYAKFSYDVNADGISELPASARQMLTGKKLEFSTAKVSVREDNTKSYFVSAGDGSGTYYDFRFNNAGKLINTVYKPEVRYATIDDLPEKVRNYLKTSLAFSPMQLLDATKFVDTAGTGYVVRLNGEQESATLNFDENGNFVDMIYQTAIFR